MPLRRSVPVRSRTLPPAGGDDLLRQRLLAGAADHPDVEPALDQEPCGAGVIGPALGGADRAGGQRHRGTGAEVVGLPPARDFLTRHDELRHRPFRRQRRAGGQRQRGILVDEAGQGLLAPAHPVDQPESGLAEKADPLGDPGQRGRNRRLPGAGQDEGGSIASGRAARRPAPSAWPPQAGCGAGPRRCPPGRPAYSRPAGRRGGSPAGRPGGSASAASAPAPRYGRGRNRRSTYRGRSGSASCRRHPPFRSHLMNLNSYLDCVAANQLRPRR